MQRLYQGIMDLILNIFPDEFLRCFNRTCICILVSRSIVETLHCNVSRPRIMVCYLNKFSIYLLPCSYRIHNNFASLHENLFFKTVDIFSGRNILHIAGDVAMQRLYQGNFKSRRLHCKVSSFILQKFYTYSPLLF